jgi:hypothetical protein
VTETSYAMLLDGQPPAGSEIHTLPERGEPSYRTIKVTRDDGSVWYCRAFVPTLAPGFVSGAPLVGPLPDGRHFSTGCRMVDRNDPQRSEWIGPPDRIEGSRDQVFYFCRSVITAFGPASARWRCQLPDVDPKEFVLFDGIDKGVLQCRAQHETQRNVDGEPIFVIFRIHVADGRILERRVETPAAQEAV